MTIILPELFIIFSAMMLCIASVICKNRPWVLSLISIFGLTAALIILFNLYGLQLLAFNSMFVINEYIVLAKILLVFSVLVGFWLFNFFGHNSYEFGLLLLLSLAGMMAMLSSTNFISLYLCAELQGLAICALIAFSRSKNTSEAALKYFVFGAISSCIMLYGISMIYSVTQTIAFDFASVLLHTTQYLVLITGVVLVLSGFAFKIGAAPFHMWAPDVYSGSPVFVTAYLASISKASYILFLSAFLYSYLGVVAEQILPIIYLMCVASLLVGAFGGLLQIDIKRLITYSSINHLGFLLLGMAAYTLQGVKSVIIYLAIYISMIIGIFAGLSVLYSKEEAGSCDIAKLNGLGKTHPQIATSLAVLMLSTAGIPPLAGFVAKFVILSAAISAKLYVLSGIALVSGVIAAFYYLKIIKVMYFETPLKVHAAPAVHRFSPALVLLYMSVAINVFASCVLFF